MPKELTADAEFDDAYALAASLTALGRPEEAVKRFREITRRWPNMPAPFTEMGKILLERGQTQEAVPWFKRAVEIDETRSAPWNNLGGAHARLGQWELAECAYTAAIKVDSENTGAMMGLAQVLMEKNPELAWKWCERAYELRPQKTKVLQVAGMVAMKTKRVEIASVIHQRLVKLDPDNQTALFNLTLTYAQRKMFPEFRVAAFRFLDRNPNDSAACKIFCQSFLDLGELNSAKEVCFRWNKIKGAEVSGTINLAHILTAEGANLLGYAALNQALEAFPRHPGLWLAVAHVLKDIPRYHAQALTAAENARTCLSEPISQPPRVTIPDIELVMRGL